jgi:hypothetical protein
VEERVWNSKPKRKKRTKRTAVRGAAALADGIMADDVMTLPLPRDCYCSSSIEVVIFDFAEVAGTILGLAGWRKSVDCLMFGPV